MEFKFSWHWLKRSLVFGLPLVPHYFAGWLLTFADRYMLERLSTIEAVGLYSLAYNVSMALSLVTSSLNQAWGPIYYDMAGDQDQRGLLPRLSTIYAAGVTIAAIAFLALSRELLVILAAERYWEAAGVVPIVTAGYYAFAMYSVLSTGTFFAKRTGRIMLLTSFAAAANIGANLLLIPRYGMYGAAWATLISYTLMAIGARVLTGWSMPGSLEDGKLLRATIVFAVAFVGNHAIDGFALPLAADILAKLALVAASAGLLMVGGVVSAHEVRRFIARMGRRNGSA
jgi:O-antigen/teichoic acid export membrane protein